MSDTQKLILIVDDDKDLREILSTKLSNAGFRVDQAPDGSSGIQKAKELKPDLILLDVRMPGMSGVEVLAQLKADPELAGLKVIFLTNLGEAKEEDSWVDTKFAKEAGAVGYIRKTDNLDKIITRIDQELALS